MAFLALDGTYRRPPVRVLVDQSGYGMANLGDRAMLEAGIAHILRLWPDADVRVLTTEPEVCARLCPGTTPVSPYVDLARIGLRGRAARLAAMLVKAHLPRRATKLVGIRDLGLVRELRIADVVLSTGGGFLNDVFGLHAAGVLSVLDVGQFRNCPTAMFGQGVGPITRRGQLRRARRVLPRLDVLGLRTEDHAPFEQELGAAANSVVTGDDALVLAGVDEPPATGDAIGLNVRFERYAGVGQAHLRSLRSSIESVVQNIGADVVAVPIVITERSGDHEAIRQLVPSLPEANTVLSVADLRRQVSQCRIVITGSYHAAIFSLARGIPVVSLARTPYYHSKFNGLARLFPAGALSQVTIRADEGHEVLLDAARQAWDMGDDRRLELVQAARVMASKATRLWDEFGSLVEEARPTALAG